MSNDLKLKGPCDCICHSNRGIMHVQACCGWSYVPRAEAEKKAAELNEKALSEMNNAK